MKIEITQGDDGAFIVKTIGDLGHNLMVFRGLDDAAISVGDAIKFEFVGGDAAEGPCDDDICQGCGAPMANHFDLGDGRVVVRMPVDAEDERQRWIDRFNAIHVALQNAPPNTNIETIELMAERIIKFADREIDRRVAETAEVEEALKATHPAVTIN